MLPQLGRPTETATEKTLQSSLIDFIDEGGKE
jgi:hypothetical protein